MFFFPVHCFVNNMLITCRRHVAFFFLIHMTFNSYLLFSFHIKSNIIPDVIFNSLYKDIFTSHGALL